MGMNADIFALSSDEKAIVLDNFINRIETINRKSGTVLGSYQVLEMLELVAIDAGYIECPHCGVKKSKGKP